MAWMGCKKGIKPFYLGGVLMEKNFVFIQVGQDSVMPQTILMCAKGPKAHLLVVRPAKCPLDTLGLFLEVSTSAAK